MSKDKKYSTTAFWWGVAESIMLFIMPDFFLLPATATKPYLWKRLVLFTLVGSMLGTILLAIWVALDPITSTDFVLKVPFVQTSMYEQVIAQINELGVPAFLRQPISGIPVKVWTVTVVNTQTSFVIYFIVLTVARGMRMFIVASIGKIIGVYAPEWTWKYRWFVLTAYIAMFFVGLSWLSL